MPPYVPLFGLLALAFFVFVWEPRRLELTRYEFVLPNLPPAFEGFQFWHVADPHLRRLGARERLLLQSIDSHPGLPLLFTGDMPLRNLRARAPFELLRNLRARGEVWMVPGNHDQPQPGRRASHPSDFAAIRQEIAKMDVQLLFNRGVALARQDQQLWLAGVDDPDKGTPDLELALSGAPPEACIVLLAHSPDIWPQARERVDLILCGHTHGGQIRLPGIGALVTRTRRTPRRWCMGLHQISPRTQMFVSRGIGVSRLLPGRLLCRPEVSLITLRRGPSK